MMGPSDRYGDMDLEDIEEFEGLEPDAEQEIDFNAQFERGETRSFENDFGYMLDGTLADMAEKEPEYDEYDEALAEEDYKAFQRHHREEE